MKIFLIAFLLILGLNAGEHDKNLKEQRAFKHYFVKKAHDQKAESIKKNKTKNLSNAQDSAKSNITQAAHNDSK